MNITKKHLSKKISDELNISNKDSLLFINSFLEIIKSHLPDVKVKIARFGTFKPKVTPKRFGRNPITMKEYESPSFKKITFNSSSEVKNILN